MAGCSRYAIEPTPENVRLLLASQDLGFPKALLILDDSILSIYVFGYSAPHPSNEEIDIFDDTLLDAFLSKAPDIYRVLVNFNNVLNFDPDGILVTTTVNRKILELEVVELLEDQLINIWLLIEATVKNGCDEEFRPIPHISGPTPYVWAIIGDSLYWSYRRRDSDLVHLTRQERREWEQMIEPYVNNALLSLLDAFIHLLPIGMQ